MFSFRGGDKTVANPGESLYKSRIFGGVFEGLPQFFHRGVNRMLKVNKCVSRPEGARNCPRVTTPPSASKAAAATGVAGPEFAQARWSEIIHRYSDNPRNHLQ